jgi:hypothetical protein
MGFLDSQTDLSGTIITSKNLEGARVYLRELISRADPQWIKKPKGHMRLNWINDGQGPVTYLVDLAYHLAVTEQALSKRSRLIFEHKIREFLKIKNDSEAENLLAEFQILSLFGNKIKPIELDPLIDPADFNAPDRAKTPDFSFETNGEKVWAEITVLYFEPLLNWKSNKDQMFSYLQRTLLNKPIRRIIEFSMPLQFSWMDTVQRFERELVPQFVEQETGEATIIINNKNILVSWKPLPHIDADFSKHPDPKSIKFPDAKFATWNGPNGLGTIIIGNVPNYSVLVVKNQSGIAVEASIQAEDVTEMIVKSIRNTLDRKREQLKILATKY